MEKSQKIVQDIQTRIKNDELNSYVYSYPSKRAYRQFEKTVSLDDLYFETKSSAELNIYLHIPFCDYRCTYCTLFLTTKHDKDLREEYVSRLIDHIKGYASKFSIKTIASIYFGGGTPTLLTNNQFERIFNAIYSSFPNIKKDCEITVEGAPDSITTELLDKLKSLGVNRMSMGIQTMVESELKHSGRPYDVERSIQAIRDIASRFQQYNLDLIYGLTHQTENSWDYTIKKTIEYAPSTLSLYAVVARPLTTIDKKMKNVDEKFLSDMEKFKLYDRNVEMMQNVGYRQESFTRFTKTAHAGYSQESSDFDGVPLLGIGAGARSYFGKYHFTTDYAVKKVVSSSIIQNFVDTPFDEFNLASHGIILDNEELKRRYIILNLSLSELSIDRYEEKFNTSLSHEFHNEIEAGVQCGLIYLDKNVYRLTEQGFKYSNLFIEYFVSDQMQLLTNNYNSK